MLSEILDPLHGKWPEDPRKVHRFIPSIVSRVEEFSEKSGICVRDYVLDLFLKKRLNIFAFEWWLKSWKPFQERCSMLEKDYLTVSNNKEYLYVPYLCEGIFPSGLLLPKVKYLFTLGVSDLNLVHQRFPNCKHVTTLFCKHCYLEEDLASLKTAQFLTDAIHLDEFSNLVLYPLVAYATRNALYSTIRFKGESLPRFLVKNDELRNEPNMLPLFWEGESL